MLLNHDLLVLVFAAVLDECKCTKSWSNLEPLRLVSSRWNDAALQPGLWRFVSVRATVPVDAFQRALARSGITPLVVAVDFRTPNADTDAFCAAIATHLARMERLELWFNAAEQSSALVHLQRPAPLLRHFALKNMPSLNPRPSLPSLDIFSFCSPALDSLELLYVVPKLFFMTSSYPAVRFISLTTAQMEWTDLVAVAAACPSLESLTLRGFNMTTAPPQASARILRTLRRLRLERAGQPGGLLAASSLAASNNILTFEALPLEHLDVVEVRTTPAAYGAQYAAVLVDRLPALTTADVAWTGSGLEIRGTTRERKVQRVVHGALSLETSTRHLGAYVKSVTMLRISANTLWNWLDTEPELPELCCIAVVWPAKSYVRPDSTVRNSKKLRAPQLEIVQHWSWAYPAPLQLRPDLAKALVTRLVSPSQRDPQVSFHGITLLS